MLKYEPDDTIMKQRFRSDKTEYQQTCQTLNEKKLVQAEILQTVEHPDEVATSINGRVNYLRTISARRLKVTCKDEADTRMVITVMERRLQERSAMKIEYDNEVDALYIRIQDKAVDHTREIEEGVNLDLDEQGAVIGLEIIGAVERYDRKDLFNIATENLAWDTATQSV